MSAFSWMAWTTPVAIFFVSIALLLIGMTLWQIRVPTLARRGFLPLVTTRGDRLFIGLLAAAYANLAWAALTDASQWFGVGVGAVLVFIVMKWG